MTVALQVLTGVHVASDGGFVSGRVARATPVAGQHIDHSTVDATILSSPISPVDGTWSLTLIRGVVYDVKIDRWAVRTIRITDEPTQDFSYYLETSLEITDAHGGTIPPGSITQYLRGDRTWQTLDKAALGLTHVDDTSDAEKPLSLAALEALDEKLTRPALTPAGKQLTFDEAGEVVASAYDVGSSSLPAPPDQTGNWAYVSLAGVQQWLELVEVTGGSVPAAQDGTATAIGSAATSETGTASAVGMGAVGAVGSSATSETGTSASIGTGIASTSGAAGTVEAGAGAPVGTGTVGAIGAEAAGETGTSTSYVLSPGTSLAVGAESAAETGTASAAGTGSTAATGTESASETGTATAAVIENGATAATGAELTGEPGTSTVTGDATTATMGAELSSEAGTSVSSGTGVAAATGAESASETGTSSASSASDGSTTATGAQGTAEAGSATATGSGQATATGAQGTAEAGSSTASGGASAAITENFDTAIPYTYAIAAAYPSNMTATATVQGWTIGSSGFDPGPVAPYYSYFNGATITTGAGGYSGNGLILAGCYTEDSESTVLVRSGYKLSKTFTGPFAAGTFSLRYKQVAGSGTATIKINGVSMGTITANSTWMLASLSVGAVANILLEIECAPASATASPPQILIDSISYS